MPSMQILSKIRNVRAKLNLRRVVTRRRLAIAFVICGFAASPDAAQAEHPWLKHFRLKKCDEQPQACDETILPLPQYRTSPQFEPFVGPSTGGRGSGDANAMGSTPESGAGTLEPGTQEPGTQEPAEGSDLPNAEEGGQPPNSDVASDTLDAAASGGDLASDLANDFDFSAADFNSSVASLGGVAGAYSAAPGMTGDFLGGATFVVELGGTQTINRLVPGTILNAAPDGSSSAQLGFDFGGGLPDDVFTTGFGSGSPLVNQFSILEPLPGSNAPGAPGPGFNFAGGTATYQPSDPNSPTPFTSGDDWLVNYSYVNPAGDIVIPVQLASPDITSRRVNLSENFSPDVRDRCFMNYSFFNDAIGNLGDVSRWVLGVERVLFEDLFSIEIRQPLSATFDSDQSFEGGVARSFEVGNMTMIGKAVLARRQNMVWTAGMGFTIPLADDSRLTRGGQTVLQIENESIHLLPFTGLMIRTGRDSVFTGYMQYDFALNGDPVRGDLFGGGLPLLGTFTDATLLHLDGSYHHTAYRGGRTDLLQTVIANFEMHYTGSLQDSDIVSLNGINVRGLGTSTNILNGTCGAHFVLNNGLVVTPGMAVPLRDGIDEQFDYEAILQVNYFH